MAKPVLEELMERFRGTAFGEQVKLWYAKLDEWKLLPKDKFVPSEKELRAKMRELALMRLGQLKIDEPKVREHFLDLMVEQPYSRRLEKGLKRYYASHGKFPDFLPSQKSNT